MTTRRLAACSPAVRSQHHKASWFLAAAALAAASTQTAQAAEPATASATAPGDSSVGAEVREEDLLLLSVGLDDLTIADSVAAYGAPEDPLLPVGELTRLLDMNVTVSASDRRIVGRVGEAERSLTVDLATGLARVGGRDIALSAEDVAVTGSEIYIRSSALSRLLPITFQTDPAEMTLKLTALEKLPIQSRLERIARLRGMRPEVDVADDVLRVETPYRLLTAPAFDVAISTARDTREPDPTGRYDIRIGADVLYTGFQGYLGSDEQGKLSSARVLFERHSVHGGLLGPIDATSAQAGDTFTPALPIGPRSAGGRGFNFTTAPLEQASIFSRIDLRGELPLGYDVELYVNDILRSGQRTPVQGRYEFLQVPLVRGLNVIRIVSYGPRGERDEQTRVVNVGGGQLAPGKTTFDFGIVQQDTPMIDLAEESLDTVGLGGVRVVASATRGISEKLTAMVGAAYYPAASGEQRSLLMAGARTSFRGFAVQADAAGDDQGGIGAAVGLAGQLRGASLLGRHAEYRGGFVDEANPTLRSGEPLLRHSELTVDTNFRRGPRSIPLSMRAQREVYADGSVAIAAAVRASSTIGPVLVSGGVDYQRETTPDGVVTQRATGIVAASTFAAYKWQLRGALDYEVAPDPRLVALTITADRAISERMALRLGVGHGFGQGGTTTVQAGANWRLARGDLALSGDYAVDDGEWRIGVQYAFGLVFDPLARRYRVTPPGPASGGNAVFQAFIDANGNGVFDPGEETVEGVSVSGGPKPATTTANGRAFITGLGASPTGRVEVGMDDVDNPFVTSPPHTVEFSPRMGSVAKIMYPLTPTGEVMAKVMFKPENGPPVGLSAVRVVITREGSEPIEGITEFDGSVAFQSLPVGTYRLELDLEQAERLHMRLRRSVTFTVAPEGGFLADINAEVIFDNPAEELQ